MKALMAFAVVSTLALVSCQQVYKDKEAEASGLLVARLSAPSFGPQDAPNAPALPAKATLISISDNDSYTQTLASEVLSMMTSTNFSGSPSSTTPASGLSGYSAVGGTNYQIVNNVGTFEYVDL